MDKATLADIDAGMGNGVCCPKQDQVAGANIAIGYRLTPALQFRNRARRHYAGSGLVNVPDKTTAVKAGLGRIAGVAIRRANKADGIDGDIARLPGGQPRRRLPGVRGR